MENLYIDVETWILHQFRRLYPQNFRFYTYFLNFMKTKMTLSVSQISMVLYTIQYSKNDVLYTYSKRFMGNRQTKIFFVKTQTSNIIWKCDGTIIKMEQTEQKLCWFDFFSLSNRTVKRDFKKHTPYFENQIKLKKTKYFFIFFKVLTNCK